MNSLSRIQFKDDLNYKCTRYAKNDINSIIISNDTIAETSYIISSINANSIKSKILEFTYLFYR
ncbi:MULTISPECIES: hypothetical protein [unclassified Clostridium]|uniref:hypothetical protein n=1 Tax=unclassified Clostridium TaxID=2614128 RepID=UPI00189C5184|nr:MULTISPECIES: hypothetical protein [unclassified Clostridium]